MELTDLPSIVQGHFGLVSFTLISVTLFAYLLYRLIYPERG